MNLLIISILLLPLTAFAYKAEVSGNLELQGRRSWNNEEAKAPPLFQDWDEDDFYLGYGNLNAKLDFAGSRLEANWFVRHSRSDLYQPAPLLGQSREPYLVTNIFTFPNRLVARDIFQLQHRRQEDGALTESVLNKFYYEWSTDEHRFTVGRMYINYGLGEIFNPINPFNQPTGLTSISQVAQGNDGGAMSFFMSDNYTINFYLLGDKRIEGYDGQINKTLWVHGEYQASEKLQLDYVVGEDQNRHKLGGQLSYKFEEAMFFTQVLYQTNYVNKKPSHNLWDLLLGYDQQLTGKWHLRGEAGYQKNNRYADLSTFGERFLPTEYFVALANIFEIHPLAKVSGTVVNDIKSGFTYLIARSTLSLSENVEGEIFGFTPISKGDATDNPVQRLVTTDVGLALRAFF
jgi:hypothetical protein